MKFSMIALIGVYFVLNCFPCLRIIAEPIRIGELPTVRYENNFQFVSMITLFAQMIFIALDRPVWQLMCGICGVLPVVRIFSRPLIDKLQGYIVYFRVFSSAPATTTTTTTSSYITAIGYVVVVLSVVLLAADIFLTAKIKQKCAAMTDNGAEKKSRGINLLAVIGVILILLALLIFKDKLLEIIHYMTRTLCC